MAYITGVVNSLADIVAALSAGCVANGWVDTSGVLSKGGCYVSTEIVDQDLFLQGGNGAAAGALTVAGPQRARVGDTGGTPLAFPLTYHLHVLAAPDEVYLLLNHDSFWQWLAFGKSPAPGLTGTGNWYAGTYGETVTSSAGFYLTPSAASGFGAYGNYGAASSGALFAQNMGWTDTNCCNSFAHIGVNPDLGGWANPMPTAVATTAYGIDAWGAQYPLVERQPNTWNGQSLLIPITPMIAHPSNKFSPGLQIAHARYVRNDNFDDMFDITLGLDTFRTYPFVRKNGQARDGSANGEIPHSGTMGWAIRYDGA